MRIVDARMGYASAPTSNPTYTPTRIITISTDLCLITLNESVRIHYGHSYNISDTILAAEVANIDRLSQSLAPKYIGSVKLWYI